MIQLKHVDFVMTDFRVIHSRQILLFIGLIIEIELVVYVTPEN